MSVLLVVCLTTPQVETQRFNAIYAQKDEATPTVDFLMLAAEKGKAIYSQAYAGLARQVSIRLYGPTCVSRLRCGRSGLLPGILMHHHARMLRHQG